jgi:hypothetical protein
LCRGILCDLAGVGNKGSGGKDDVKFHDLGSSARGFPELDVSLGVPFEVPFEVPFALPFEAVERCEAIWARRMRGINGRERTLESMYFER